MSDAILCEVADGIARITLNRPETLNAFSGELAVAWEEIMTATIARDDVRVILLTGKGRAFCAGGNLHEMHDGGFSGEAVTNLADVINRGQVALLESTVPVVAAVQGPVAGGGLGILLNSDYAVLSETASIGSIYAKIGLTPDLTVSALLARAVGERRALQLVLQDRMLTAQEALEWGIAAEVVSDEEVFERAEQVATFIAQNAAHARGQAKRLVRASYGRSVAESAFDEARTIGAAITTEDARTRIRAFVGK